MPIVDLLPSAQALLEPEIEELAAVLLEDIHRQRGDLDQTFDMDNQFDAIRAGSG